MKIKVKVALFPVEVPTTEGIPRTLADYSGTDIPARPFPLPLHGSGIGRDGIAGAITSLYREGGWVYGRGWISSRQACGAELMRRLLLLRKVPLGVDLQLAGQFPAGTPLRFDGWEICGARIYLDPSGKPAWPSAGVWLPPEAMDTWWVQHFWLPATWWLWLRVWWLTRVEPSWGA